jgi:single-stranded-DNA-specific exonuclease
MEPVREKRWRVAEPDECLVAALSRECSVSPLAAALLVNRGIERPDAAKRFLSSSLAELHDPFLLLDMEKAVERLKDAIINGERICVYGDYDVDGVTSVTLLTSFLRTLGVDCVYHIPNRLEDGYGLSATGIRSAFDSGARLIVTADCGITACAEAELCASLGIDLIITDHHTPSGEIPSALAVINPLRPGCLFPFKSLAGVGVVFNLVIALRSCLRAAGFFEGRNEPNLREYLDLVALGTIADIVPLVDENRILVSHGLRELTVASRTGVRALKTVSGINGDVDCGAVGFRLAPRLNAAGRLEDAATGVELLLTDDGALAASLAGELNASNEERQCLEQSIILDALEKLRCDPAMATRKSIVLASASWHHGVIGIVASRLVDLFHRPTILIALEGEHGKGSGRSIPGFHLHEALSACSQHLVRFGGHKYAAGLTVGVETLRSFIERFDEIAEAALAVEDLLPELRIDAELAPEQISLQTAEEITSLEPFGMGNPRPVFLLRNVGVLQKSVLKEKHVRLRLVAGGLDFEAIGFNLAEGFPDHDTLDVAFSLDINVWNGKRSARLRIKDVRASA